MSNEDTFRNLVLKLLSDTDRGGIHKEAWQLMKKYLEENDPVFLEKISPFVHVYEQHDDYPPFEFRSEVYINFFLFFLIFFDY